MTISALPSAPLITDAPDVFDTKASAHVASLSTLVTEMNAAISAVNMTKWISGTTYAIGDVTWSPADFQAYRRKTAGAGTTDPSADTTNWQRTEVSATTLQNQNATAFTTGGTSTAFTLTPTPAIAALATNQLFHVTFNAAAGATPTLAVSGLTAKNLKYKDSTGAKQAITSVQVPSGWVSDVEYDGTDYVVLSVALQNKPAFSVGKNNVNQTGIVTSTYTKVTWATEDFDTNNNFATDRFTPTVAGKYLLTAGIVFIAPVTGATMQISIFKNGSQFRTNTASFSGTNAQGINISAVVDANGTTDYFEIYCYQATGANKDIDGNAVNAYFAGGKID